MLPLLDVQQKEEIFPANERTQNIIGRSDVPVEVPDARDGGQMGSYGLRLPVDTARSLRRRNLTRDRTTGRCPLPCSTKCLGV